MSKDDFLRLGGFDPDQKNFDYPEKSDPNYPGPPEAEAALTDADFDAMDDRGYISALNKHPGYSWNKDFTDPRYSGVVQRAIKWTQKLYDDYKKGDKSARDAIAGFEMQHPGLVGGAGQAQSAVGAPINHDRYVVPDDPSTDMMRRSSIDNAFSQMLRLSAAQEMARIHHDPALNGGLDWMINGDQGGPAVNWVPMDYPGQLPKGYGGGQR